MKKELGIYIHIPFCTSRCPYCDFYSNAAAGDESRYAAAVAAQLVQWSCTGERRRRFRGGTPTSFRCVISLLMDALGGHYDIEPGAEISCECNTADAEYRAGASLEELAEYWRAEP